MGSDSGCPSDRNCGTPSPNAARTLSVWGGVCYIRLGGETLAKAALTSGGGNYDGIQVTVLNRRTGPVDSITIRSWDVPHGVKKPPDFGEKADWDIYRPTLDIDRLWELAEEYLRLFQEPDTEMR